MISYLSAQDSAEEYHGLRGLTYGTSRSFSNGQNFNRIHQNICFTAETKKATFLLGPQYSLIVENDRRANKVYDDSAFGLYLGTNFDLVDFSDKLKLEVNFSFSVYRAKSSRFSLGTPPSVEKEFIVENQAALQLSFQVKPSISLYLGAGIANNNGFFLLASSSYVTNNIGIVVFLNAKS